jgi:anti-anti-sigma factor
MAIADEQLGRREAHRCMTGHVQVLFDDRETLVALSGEVDLALGRELADHAQDVTDREAQVRLDVTRLSFIDSIGLGFVARIAQAGRAIGCPLVVVGASRRIRESIALAGIGWLVDYED